jgi:hypothetical protein
MFPERKGDTLIEDLRLGVIEEVGELSHAILKNRQGIRGMKEGPAFIAARDDAIGDILVYYIQLCTAQGGSVTWLGGREPAKTTVPQSLSTVATCACAEFPLGYFTMTVKSLAAATGLECEEVLERFFTVAETVMKRSLRTEKRDEA